ncbi:EAL domain-containing protein [Allofranklinella schreckenbergeri]|uniref:EAL domain-containing protein n=1 Tax=Allofranklinella schreckenbergeri TaxID=1076744 RepID=A0A3M6R8G7_9BURK|nr:GGDEF and EAL domain-containing protein [Allofranklinella schreckenbergeri]RMX11534.1 EAL domain-containing protein [Allofranklinella schreckenbergeri]
MTGPVSDFVHTSLPHAGLRHGDGWHHISSSQPIAVCLLNREGTLLDLNPSALQLFSCTARQAFARKLSDFINDWPRHVQALRAAVDQGQRYYAATAQLRVGGRPMPVVLEGVGIQHNQQILMTIRCLCDSGGVDVLQTVDHGVVMHDAEGHLVYINQAALCILNHPPEGLQWRDGLYSQAWRYVDEQGAPLPLEETPTMQALRTGSVKQGIMGLYREEDQYFRWLKVMAIPLTYVPGGAHEQVLTLLDDVTRQRRDESMFNRLQALSAMGAWECSNNYCHMTEGALRILGLEAQPTSLQDFLACFSPVNAARLGLAVQQALSERSSFSVELSLPGVPLRWLRVRGEPDHLDPLSSRISGTLEDISREKRTQAYLHQKSRTDTLTGLLNRDAILLKLKNCLESDAPDIAVLYIDLDRFKLINDALGHDVGDRVLQEAARRLRQATPEGGRCARMGGDEFLMLCPEHEHQTPAFVAERILGLMSLPFQIGHTSLNVCASIGIARAPQDGKDASTLIQNADAAMYECKRRVGNSWQFYSQDLARRQREKLQFDILLRRAMDENELRLFYQPQVDLRTGHLVGAEALMRWHSKVLGMVPPKAFIEHAENCGEIIRIGSWALREACLQVQRWREMGLTTVPISVNVSYRQFLTEDLAFVVADALRSADLDSKALELEFTERVLIEDDPLTARTVARLRELGITLSIDDFGEGYSALNYLRRLPVQKLKLSREFLQGVPGDRSDVVICQAVASITQNLGLGLIAEGVETPAQRQLLLDIGVSHAQGYLFAPPLVPDAFAQWLARPDRWGQMQL